MSKSIPSVQKYMTVLPHSIGVDQTLAHAEKMMTELRVRHLPVLDGGRIVGVLSDRDVKLVESFKDVDPEKVKVDEAYSPDPYIVNPGTPLNEICETMAAKRYSCVLIEDNHKLVGIFTWIDALRAFSEMMETRLKL